jgi:hypothetical protein
LDVGFCPFYPAITLITRSQKKRGENYGSQTYLDERQAMIKDLADSGVPTTRIDDVVSKVDAYFQGLWSGITDANKRQEIFGNVEAVLDW